MKGKRSKGKRKEEEREENPGEKIEGKGYFCWQYSQGLIIPSWEHHFGHDIEECCLLHSQCLQNLNITGMATILSKCFHLLTLGRARLIINQYLHEKKTPKNVETIEGKKISISDCLMERDHLQPEATLSYIQIGTGISSLKAIVIFLWKINSVFCSSVSKFLYFQSCLSDGRTRKYTCGH